MRPVVGVIVGSADVVAITVADWVITMAGVASTARSHLSSAVARRCLLTASGRYGRYWWITVSRDDSERPACAVLLGTHLTLTHVRGGSGRSHPPEPVSPGGFAPAASEGARDCGLPHREIICRPVAPAG